MSKFKRFSLGAAAFLIISACDKPHIPVLPGYGANGEQVSVSGLSSGAFMAVQLHMAHSQKIKGVGVFAGGPYLCSGGSATTALTDCMAPKQSSRPDIKPLVAKTKALAAQGKIDSLDHLKTTKVWLFSGTNDTVVHPQVMNQLKAYYQHFVPDSQIVYVNDHHAGHAMITQNYGNDCAQNKSPFISKCGFDGAGQVLQHIYGPLNPPTTSLKGELIEFGQMDFTDYKPPVQLGLANKGYAYVPQTCKTTSCRIHVFLHGCLQNSDAIGQELVKHAGFNEWAETNQIIILYPQTHKSLVNPVNPMGCWDWWGYSNPEYYSKEAPQIEAIMGMIAKLTEPYQG